MFSGKSVCNSCSEMCHWLASLSFIALGGIVILQKLAVFPETVFGWMWPVLLVIWGVVGLYHSSCRECHK